MADGRAPGVGRGYAAHRLLGRLWLPRPVTIGLAAPFARPARTAVTLAAVLFGATAVIFTAGLGSSLGRVVSGLSLTSTEQVQIQVPPARLYATWSYAKDTLKAVGRCPRYLPLSPAHCTTRPNPASRPACPGCRSRPR